MRKVIQSYDAVVMVLCWMRVCWPMTGHYAGVSLQLGVTICCTDVLCLISGRDFCLAPGLVLILWLIYGKIQ